MTLREFLRRYRSEIDDAIHTLSQRYGRLNDKEREAWIMNDEDLHLWAKAKGLRL